MWKKETKSLWLFLSLLTFLKCVIFFKDSIVQVDISLKIFMKPKILERSTNVLLL